MRLPLVVPAIALAALLSPSAALASRADVTGPSSDRSLAVQGGAVQRNDIAVTSHRSPAGDAFFLVTEARDGGPRVLAGDGCTTGSNISQATAPNGLFPALRDLIFGNPLFSGLANEITNRSKTVGCITSGTGSLVELNGGETVRRILIDLKDRDDSAFVQRAVTPGLAPPPVPPVEMRGGAGEDRLTGGPNSDVINGENGDDRVFSNEGIPDTVLCGNGTDTVFADLKDTATADCESVQKVAFDESPGATIVTTAARLTGSGRLRIRLKCPRVAHDGCEGVLSISARKRELGSRAYRLAAGRSRVVTLRLHGKVPGRVRALALEHDSQGREKTHSVLVRL
jgi:hypothetical protein